MGGSLPKEVRERIGIIKRDDGAELNLRDCKLKVIPAKELSKLKNLKRVNLEKNDINELPAKKIHKLLVLEYLNLSFNNIEQLPVEIVFLHNLVELNMASNRISIIPEGISSLHKLQKLNLSQNPIGNKLPADLMKGSSDSLIELRLSGCEISEVPNSILVLRNLKVLDLSANPLGKYPAELEALTSLNTLNLARCKISSSTLEYIAALKNLKHLDISGNAIPVLPEQFFQLHGLETLDISENGLTVLPVELGSLDQLVELQGHHNKLQAIPPTIGQLTKLRIFNFGFNQLKSIPHQLGFCYQTLRKVILNSNQMTEVPGELSFLHSSCELDFANNPLKPQFASWINEGNLTKLQPLLRAYGPKCVAEGGATTQAKVSTGCSFVIKAHDYIGKLRSTGGDRFSCFVVGPLPIMIQEELIIKDEKNGTYMVYYNLMKPGTYTLNICLIESGYSSNSNNNENANNLLHIKDSPFQLVVE